MVLNVYFNCLAEIVSKSSKGAPYRLAPLPSFFFPAPVQVELTAWAVVAETSVPLHHAFVFCTDIIMQRPLICRKNHTSVSSREVGEKFMLRTLASWHPGIQ